MGNEAMNVAMRQCGMGMWRLITGWPGNEAMRPGNEAMWPGNEAMWSVGAKIRLKYQPANRSDISTLILQNLSCPPYTPTIPLARA